MRLLDGVRERVANYLSSSDDDMVATFEEHYTNSASSDDDRPVSPPLVIEAKEPQQAGAEASSLKNDDLASAAGVVAQNGDDQTQNEDVVNDNNSDSKQDAPRDTTTNDLGPDALQQTQSNVENTIYDRRQVNASNILSDEIQISSGDIQASIDNNTSEHDDPEHPAGEYLDAYGNYKAINQPYYVKLVRDADKNNTNGKKAVFKSRFVAEYGLSEKEWPRFLQDIKDGVFDPSPRKKTRPTKTSASIKINKDIANLSPVHQPLNPVVPEQPQQAVPQKTLSIRLKNAVSYLWDHAFPPLRATELTTDAIKGYKIHQLGGLSDIVHWLLNMGFQTGFALTMADTLLKLSAVIKEHAGDEYWQSVLGSMGKVLERMVGLSEMYSPMIRSIQLLTAACAFMSAVGFGYNIVSFVVAWLQARNIEPSKQKQQNIVNKVKDKLVRRSVHRHVKCVDLSMVVAGMVSMAGGLTLVLYKGMECVNLYNPNNPYGLDNTTTYTIEDGVCRGNDFTHFQGNVVVPVAIFALSCGALNVGYKIFIKHPIERISEKNSLHDNELSVVALQTVAQKEKVYKSTYNNKGIGAALKRLGFSGYHFYANASDGKTRFCVRYNSSPATQKTSLTQEDKVTIEAGAIYFERQALIELSHRHSRLNPNDIEPQSAEARYDWTMHFYDALKKEIVDISMRNKDSSPKLSQPDDLLTPAENLRLLKGAVVEFTDFGRIHTTCSLVNDFKDAEMALLHSGDPKPKIIRPVPKVQTILKFLSFKQFRQSLFYGMSAATVLCFKYYYDNNDFDQFYDTPASQVYFNTDLHTANIGLASKQVYSFYFALLKTAEKMSLASFFWAAGNFLTLIPESIGAIHRWTKMAYVDRVKNVFKGRLSFTDPETLQFKMPGFLEGVFSQLTATLALMITAALNSTLASEFACDFNDGGVFSSTFVKDPVCATLALMDRVGSSKVEVLIGILALTIGINAATTIVVAGVQKAVQMVKGPQRVTLQRVTLDSGQAEKGTNEEGLRLLRGGSESSDDDNDGRPEDYSSCIVDGSAVGGELKNISSKDKDDDMSEIDHSSGPDDDDDCTFDGGEMPPPSGNAQSGDLSNESEDPSGASIIPSVNEALDGGDLNNASSVISDNHASVFKNVPENDLDTQPNNNQNIVNG
jgi:hypothetical protein